MFLAMIVNNKVIEVITSDFKPEWPPTPEGIVPVAIECDSTVERGMIYDEGAKTFSYPIEPQPEVIPTQLDNIEATQLTIMTAMAEQYEESLERELINMEVQATIYEAILEMGGVE